jgi:hypothetical protein
VVVIGGCRRWVSRLGRELGAARGRRGGGWESMGCVRSLRHQIVSRLFLQPEAVLGIHATHLSIRPHAPSGRQNPHNPNAPPTLSIHQPRDPRQHLLKPPRRRDIILAEKQEHVSLWEERYVVCFEGGGFWGGGGVVLVWGRWFCNGGGGTVEVEGRGF